MRVVHHPRVKNVTPEQRRRAGRAVAERIEAMAATPTAIARLAGISPKTVTALIRGDTWPTEAVQERLEAVMGWRPGALVVRAVRGGLDGALDALTDVELSAELTRRLVDRDKRVATGGWGTE